MPRPFPLFSSRHLRTRFLPNRVQVFRPEKVTTHSPREEDPEAGGLHERDVEAIWAAVVAYYRMGLQPAMSLCIRRRGRVVLERTIGHIRGNEPGAPPGDRPLATPETLFNFFSGSKAITAMLIHLLAQDGVLGLDDRICRYIPRFVGGGKERVTVRHVLTHRAGIPTVPSAHMNLDLLSEPDRILKLLCEAPLQTLPGVQQAYHAITGGFVLEEITQRVTGASLQDLLRERIAKPLSFGHLRYGVERESLPHVAQDTITGPPARTLDTLLVKRALGVGMEEAVAMARDERFLSAVVPSANIISTAHDIGRFFELLLRGGSLDGIQVFDPVTVARAAAEQTAHTPDRMLLLPIRFSMGFILGGRTFSFYGPESRRAFGHLGFTNIVAWADP